MAPSTEQFDDLLAWHPGDVEAARGGPLTALVWGARRAANAKLLIFWLWLAHALFLQGAAGAFLEAVRAGSSASDVYRALLDAGTSGAAFTIPSLDAGARAMILASISRPLWSPSAYFILFYGVLAGGAIAYLHAPRPAPFLPQFGAACGAYVGRFTRLLLIAAFLSWALQLIGAVLFRSPAVGNALWLQLLLWQPAVVGFAAVMDYARVRAVSRDSRSMVLETARSARFFIRNLPRTLSLELALVVVASIIGAAALGLASALRAFLPADTALWVGEQVYVVGALWVRLTAWAAMLSLYQGITAQRLSRGAAPVTES